MSRFLLETEGALEYYTACRAECTASEKGDGADKVLASLEQSKNEDSLTRRAPDLKAVT